MDEDEGVPADEEEFEELADEDVLGIAPVAADGGGGDGCR